MTLQGKGYFIWRIPYCESGNVNAIASLAQQAAFTHVLVKVADGAYSYNIDPNGVDLVPPLVNALKARNIKVWGWHYLYGDYPTSEADKAIQRINQLKLDGYALDVEGEYKQAGKDAAARTFMNRLRNALPNLPIALCSYRFPSYHPQIPWKEFLEKCNLNMPQVYWEQSHNPAEQLARCVREFQAMAPYRPIVPVGSAYTRGGWAPTAAEIIQFLQTAQSLNLTAANFWEWGHTRKYLPDLWNFIRDYPWSSTPVTPDVTHRYIDALNSHDPSQVLALYAPNAVHVTSARTVQGAQGLRAWYQTLFTQTLPNATFTHTGHIGAGASRYLTWTATSSAGRVNDGRDTFGMLNGLIAYHFTTFTITR
ncbi:MAG: nuclear transport factor 2 family protein [Anaerolineales bacterium]|nr:nuclear transport factor 2 family protein [Anaerolineales bacterium]